MQFSFEGLSWIIEDVSKEDVGSGIVKEVNEDSTDTYGALVDIRLVS